MNSIVLKLVFIEFEKMTVSEIVEHHLELWSIDTEMKPDGHLADINTLIDAEPDPDIKRTIEDSLIRTMQTEIPLNDKRKVVLDVFCRIRMPDDGNVLWLDVELQNSETYSEIHYRSQMYASSILCAVGAAEPLDRRYKMKHKVLSLWLLSSLFASVRGRVLMNEPLTIMKSKGQSSRKINFQDMPAASFAFIGLSDDFQAEERMLSVLNILFSVTMTSEEKRTKLAQCGIHLRNTEAAIMESSFTQGMIKYQFLKLNQQLEESRKQIDGYKKREEEFRKRDKESKKQVEEKDRIIDLLTKQLAMEREKKENS